MKTLQWETKFMLCYSEDVVITFVSLNLACIQMVYIIVLTSIAYAYAVLKSML